MLGFIYRIYLSRVIGAEGVGIYQIAFGVMGFLMTIVSAGVPITISRIMAKHRANGNPQLINSTVTAGIVICLAMSIPIFIIMYFLPNFCGFMFADSRCMVVLRVAMPAFVFTTVYSVIRGFFWGNSYFFTYSIIDFVEELTMMVLGIILVGEASSMLEGVKNASLAVAISYMLSFSLAFFMFFIKGGRFKNPKTQLRQLFVSSTPITLMRTSASGINCLVGIIMPFMLVKFGMTKTQAMTQFGAVFGMAIPLVFVPATLLSALTLVFTPKLSANYYSKKLTSLRLDIEKCLKFAIIIACLIAPIFLTLGKQICLFLYNNTLAGNCLSLCSAIVLPMSFTLISTSILNCLNKERKTLTSHLTGGLAMLLSIIAFSYFIGIYALIVGMFLNFLISAIRNLVMLDKITHNKLHYKLFLLKATIIVLPTSVFGVLLSSLLSNFVRIFWVIALTSSCQILFSLLLYVTFGLINCKLSQSKFSFSNC